jgi:hypothetical protein
LLAVAAIGVLLTSRFLSWGIQIIRRRNKYREDPRDAPFPSVRVKRSVDGRPVITPPDQSLKFLNIESCLWEFSQSETWVGQIETTKDTNFYFNQTPSFHRKPQATVIPVQAHPSGKLALAIRASAEILRESITWYLDFEEPAPSPHGHRPC